MQRRRGLTLGVVLVGLLGFGIAFVAIGQRVPTDDPQPGVFLPLTDDTTDEDNASTISGTVGRYTVFPQMRGTTLDFDTVSIPDDLSTGPKLMVVSYSRDQQEVVNEWLEPLLELNANFPTLSGYYTPLLPKDTADSALLIVGGFAALANAEARDRTIVVFTDVERFNELININTTDDVQLFLLDERHQIRWQSSGAVSKVKLNALETALLELATTLDLEQ